MARAIETGLPKMRIEEASARRQARIDAGREVIVGVNKYRREHEAPLDVLEVDNRAVRANQVRRLEEIRRTRNGDAVQRSLDALVRCAESGDGNLLALTIEAARARATLGEIPMPSSASSGSTAPWTAPSPGCTRPRARAIPSSSARASVRPRSPSRRGAARACSSPSSARTVTTVARRSSRPRLPIRVRRGRGPALPDAGRSGADGRRERRARPRRSSVAGGHKTLVPEVIAQLKALGRDDILVVAAGSFRRRITSTCAARAWRQSSARAALFRCARSRSRRAHRHDACGLMRTRLRTPSGDCPVSPSVVRTPAGPSRVLFT